MKTYSKQASKFYKSKLWQKVRLNYLISQNYICERCGNVAEIVHHKQYINDTNLNDHNILTNFDNLEALCMDCHNREHFKKSATRKGFAFDDEGRLIAE